MEWINKFMYYLISTGLSGGVLVTIWIILNRVFGKYITSRANYFIFRISVCFFILPIIFIAKLYDVIFNKYWEDYLLPIELTNIATERIGMIVFIIWIIGVICMLARHIFLSIKFYVRVVSLSARTLDKEILDILEREKALLHISRKIEVWINPELGSPILSGNIFRPRIILPRKFSEEQLRVMIYHELIHYKRHDLFKKRFGMLVWSLHWGNPVVYYLLELTNKWCEYVCDEICCMKKHNEFTAQVYAKTLSELVNNKETNYTAVYSAFSEDQSQLLQRVRRISILTNFKNHKIVTMILCIIFIFIGSISAFAVGSGFSKQYSMLYNETTTFVELENGLVEETTNADSFVREEINFFEQQNNIIEEELYCVWYLKANGGITYFDYEFEKGDRIEATFGIRQKDTTIRVGLIEPNGTVNYIDDFGLIQFEYTFLEKGTYRVFAQNSTMEKVYINLFLSTFKIKE